MQSVQHEPGEFRAVQELQQHVLLQQGMEPHMCQQYPATSADLQHADLQPSQQEEHQKQEQAEQPAPAWQNYSSVFTAAKAGMGGVDQQKVKQVVYEMSKNSAHFANEQRKQAQTDARIARLKAQAAQLTPVQLASHQKACDAKISLLEAGRDLSKVWLHVDMDAFYASVEELEQPTLKDKPMAVGGMGMICTANYVARRFGVRSAMPGFIAKKLCPQLVFVKPDFSKYTAASAQAFAVFRAYDAAVEGASLDEAYLDVTQYCSAHGMIGEQVAEELRSKVVEATGGLTCSVGVAPNMMLAKIASDRNKPNGQCAVAATREAVLNFIADLPIRKIPGIGKVTEQTLQALGVSICSDLIAHAALLTALLSDISSSSLIQAGLGLGSTQHSSRASGGGEGGEPGRKGISCERTFGAMSLPGDMEQMAESLVAHLASDMAREGIEAKTLTLKLKTTAFEVRTRAVTLPSYVSSPAAMLPPILKLLRAELPVEIRLMGVRGSTLRLIPQSLQEAAAGGRRLNALERLVLQGRQQQQQGVEAGEGVKGAGQQPAEAAAGQQQEEAAEAAQQQQLQQQWDAADEQQQEQELLQLHHSLQLPTQQQLEADYEQHCMQQQQQDLYVLHQQDWQQQCNTGSDQDSGGAGGVCVAEWDNEVADILAAADGLQGWESNAAQQEQHHHQQQQHPYQNQPLPVLQHPYQQQQQQPVTGDYGQDHSTQQPSKRRRRSFSQPTPAQPASYQHQWQQQQQGPHQQQERPQQQCVLQLQEPEPQGCADPVHLQKDQQQQPQQQQEWQAAAGQPQAGSTSCWQKASDFKQPQQQPGVQSAAHHTTLQHQQGPVVPLMHQQQHQQHIFDQHQHHSYPEAAAAAVFSAAGAAAAGPVSGRLRDAAGAGVPVDSSKHRNMQGAPSSSRRSSSSAGPWTCLACTFSGNGQQWLRCSVCDTPKGDTAPPPTAAAAAPIGGGSSGRVAGTGRGGRRGGSKQVTLERLGLGLQKHAGH